jgi:aldehyde:ferredoxin oxidoreductase
LDEKEAITMIGGYTGKILNVNLTSQTVTVENLEDQDARLFIGTYGLGSRLLYRRMRPGVDPLGPDNILGFITGPLTGTGALFGGRFCVVCKSPVNGGWNDANCGGHFGPEVKKAGFDAVLITGASDHPVYLWIQDGVAEIRDASHLWGKECPETEDLLAKELGDPRVSSAVIGHPGENLAWMAAIMNDKHRALARGGVGAVMGSKKLKAVVAHGTGKVPVADQDKLRQLNRTIIDAMKNGPEAGSVMGFSQQGTGMGNIFCLMSGDSPVKNWSGFVGDDYEGMGLDIGQMDEKYKFKRYACANCPMGCGAEYDVQEGTYPVGKTHRPEYETTAAFGGLVLNEDLQAIIMCNDICNRFGIDTISTGGTIAWAIECAENGLLSKEETDGIELKWGNGAAIVSLTQSIADGRGFGRILMNGSQFAARTLNKGYEYLQVVRGMELPLHDPKLFPGYARTYQVDPTPGRHVKPGLAYLQMGMDDEVRYDYLNTGEADKKASCNIEMAYISGACEFLRIPGLLDLLMQMMEVITGWPFGEAEREAASLRSLNMRQVFNLREGILPKDSVLPGRAIGNPPFKSGLHEGRQVDASALSRNFHQVMEWDEITGKPSRKLLERLGGFDDVIQDLYA